jgi:hypothetical protein
LRKRSTPPPAPPESSDIAKLAEVVESLTHQVQHLAMILDEVREDLVWAVRNDKFHCAGHSQHYVASSFVKRPSDRDDEEEESETVNPPPVKPTSPAAAEKSLFD